MKGNFPLENKVFVVKAVFPGAQIRILALSHFPEQSNPKTYPKDTHSGIKVEPGNTGFHKGA